MLDTWGMFQKHCCFSLVFLRRAYLPPVLLDPYASGSAAMSHFINVFGEKEKEVGVDCDLVPSFLVSLKIATQQY